MEQVFTVNFAKILRTTFLQNTSGGCFCASNYWFICKINIRGYCIWKHIWQHQIPVFRLHYFAHFRNCSQRYMLTGQIIISFKVLKYFSSVKIKFFLFAKLWQEISNWIIFFFFSKITHNSRLNGKKVVIPPKKFWLVV